jgi:hypothetical protein
VSDAKKLGDLASSLALAVVFVGAMCEKGKMMKLIVHSVCDEYVHPQTGASADMLLIPLLRPTDKLVDALVAGDALPTGNVLRTTLI